MMPWFLLDIIQSLPTFALVMFRLSGLMLTAPIYGSQMVPRRVRVAITLTVSAMMFPLVRSQAPANLTLSDVVVGGVSELAIGVSIGLALSVMLMAAEVAGLIVGRQAGLALSNVFDPTSNEQVSITGQIYGIMLTLTFILAGGLRASMAALLDTFEVIPLLSFQLGDSVVLLLTEMLGAAMMLGIRIAGPVLIALFLLSIAMAFLSRTMPQFNILSIGFTLRALVALGVAALALNGGEQLFLDAIWDGIEQVRANFGLDPAATRLVT